MAELDFAREVRAVRAAEKKKMNVKRCQARFSPSHGALCLPDPYAESFKGLLCAPVLNLTPRFMLAPVVFLVFTLMSLPDHVAKYQPGGQVWNDDDPSQC